MAAEIKALEDSKTWTQSTLLEGKKPIWSKWVYKIKCRADDSIERYKTRLVAKGFFQIKCVDFHETFSTMAKLVIIRYLVFLPLHWLIIGSYIIWMSTIHFYMATWMIKSI